MTIRNRLREIAERHGLASRLPTRLEREADISRKTARKLIDNELERYTPELLEKVCRWLRKHNVDEDLPGALFVEVPDKLLGVLAEPGHVTIYLGAYVQPDTDVVAPWLSQADFELACFFIKQLSQARQGANGSDGARPVHFDVVAVPSHLNPQAHGNTVDLPHEPTEVARDIFRDMRRDRTTNLILGSPRANLLTDLFLADLFAGRPFVEDGAGTAPFYLVKPDTGNVVAPSSFCGTRGPQANGRGAEGILFRRRSGTWEFIPARRGAQDSGIVIVRHDPGRGQTDMAIFGFSSSASSAMAQVLDSRLDEFWQDLEPLKGGVRSSVSLCAFSLRPAPEFPGRMRRQIVHDLEIIRLPLPAVARPGGRRAE